MKKKNNCKQKNSYLLDTSVQMERCKNPEVSDFLYKRTSDGSTIVCSFFVLYEFKTGLLKSIIEFYFLVKLLGDVSKAFSQWSDKFQIRQVKNALIMTSVIFRISTSIKCKDINLYLRKLRAVIFNLEEEFYTYVSSMVGEFQNDEIIKLNIRNEKEYGEFISAYNRRKCLPLSDFWIKYDKELVNLLNCDEFRNDKKLTSMYKYLKEIKDDIKNADKLRNNKGIGDAIISVDCGKKRTVLSFDNSFSVLCPPLQKRYEVINRADI